LTVELLLIAVLIGQRWWCVETRLCAADTRRSFQ